jgi:serine/threonine protein phosphatase PrpC
MGSYLSQPNLDKSSEIGDDLDCQTLPISYACVEMQGWRRSMEDAHIIDTRVSIVDSPTCTNPGDAKLHLYAKVFGVFDGHGGPEVARFCEKYFIQVLQKEQKWVEGDIQGALIEAFHTLDLLIDDPGRREELNSLRNHNPSSLQETDVGASSSNNSQVEQETTVIAAEKTSSHIIQQQEVVPEDDEVSSLDTEESCEGISDDSLLDDEEEKEQPNPEQQQHEAQRRKLTVGEAMKLFQKLLILNTRLQLQEHHPHEPQQQQQEQQLHSEDGAKLTTISTQNEEKNETEQVQGYEEEKEEVIHFQSEEHSSNNSSSDIPYAVHTESTCSSTCTQTTITAAESYMVETCNSKINILTHNVTVIDPGAQITLEEEEQFINIHHDTRDITAEKTESTTMEERTFHTTTDIGSMTTTNDTTISASTTTTVNTSTSTTSNHTAKEAVSTSFQASCFINGKQVCNLSRHPVQAGCTSIVVVFVGRQYYVANAGDSRAVLGRRGGRAIPLSEDHKPIHKTEMDRITKAGGFVNRFGRVNGNLNLSRSIGDLKYKQIPGLRRCEQMITAEPDVKQFTIDSDVDEFIIIGCDGIWDCLSNEEAVNFVLQRIHHQPPQKIVEEMLDQIVSKDPSATMGIGGDNMTCIIIDLLPHSRHYHQK